MPKILSQLRCGRCQGAFWPELGAAEERVAFCEHCDAPHANPDAVTFRWEDMRRFANRAVNTLIDWMQVWWPDTIPSAPELTFAPASVHSGSVNGFACMVVMVSQSQGSGAYVLVAALPPPRPVAGWNVVPAGMWALRRDTEWAAISAYLREVIPALRAAGAEPLYRLEEIEDTVPLTREPMPPADPEADARLTSLRLDCPSCGGPSTAGTLVGDGRCPYCGTPQVLDPAIRGELERYQRRVQAAQCVIPARFELHFGRAFVQARADEVPLACAHCGAPNRHQPDALDERCTSCGAPLIPDHDALARGLRNDRMRAAAERRAVAVRVASGGSAQRTLVAVLGLNSVGLLMYPMALLANPEAWEYWPWAVGGGVALAVVTTALVLPAWRMRERDRGRWQRVYGALAEQLGAAQVGFGVGFRGLGAALVERLPGAAVAPLLGASGRRLLQRG